MFIRAHKILLSGVLLMPLSGCSTVGVHAIESGDVEAVRALLDQGKVGVNRRLRVGVSAPICVAARSGQIKVAELLLERGSGIDSCIESIYTPLMVAALYGQADMARFLVSRGADIDAKIRLSRGGGLSAQDIAAANGHHDIAKFLREAQAKASAESSQALAKPASASSVPAAAARAVTSDIDEPSRRGAERPDDFALVIGIEEYQNVSKADYGARDAKAVRKHLEALGFPSRNIISLSGSEATGTKLRSYLEEWLPLNVKPTSTLVVYYSGHGAPDIMNGDAYLVPWDGDPKFLKTTALPLTKLYSDLSKTKAKRVIVALDACFSGAGGRSVLAKGARPLVAKLADTAPAGGNLTVLAAASGDEITGSLDEQGHGMFTYHLLKGLSADPKASAKTLFQYVMPRVQDDARRQNRVQTPVLAGASLTEPLLP